MINTVLLYLCFRMTCIYTSQKIQPGCISSVLKIHKSTHVYATQRKVRLTVVNCLSAVVNSHPFYLPHQFSWLHLLLFRAFFITKYRNKMTVSIANLSYFYYWKCFFFLIIYKLCFHKEYFSGY